MKLVTYLAPSHPSQPRPGVVLASGRILELPYASMLAFIQAGAAAWEEARQRIANADTQKDGIPPDGVRLLAPLQ
ncbi:MAG: hypothetical protein WHV44_02115, partial [Anaerolineales bacterium]